MGGKENRFTFSLCFPHDLLKLGLHQRVQAAGGLIEDKNLGLVHEGADHGEFLLVAAREGADGPR